MRTVIGGVHDDSVVGDAQLVQLVQHLADQLVVRHHHVVVEALPALAQMLLSRVRAEVHGSGVPPEEKGLARLAVLLHEPERALGDLFVYGLHALLGEGPGVLDPPVGVAVDDAPWTEALAESRIFGIVQLLRLLLGIEVVQVPEELVEPVNAG